MLIFYYKKPGTHAPYIRLKPSDLGMCQSDGTPCPPEETKILDRFYHYESEGKLSIYLIDENSLSADRNVINYTTIIYSSDFEQSTLTVEFVNYQQSDDSMLHQLLQGGE